MDTSLESELENVTVEHVDYIDTDVFIRLANGKRIRLFSDSLIKWYVEDVD